MCTKESERPLVRLPASPGHGPPAFPPKDGSGRLFEKMAVLTEALEFPDIHLFEGFLHGFPEGLVCIAHAAL